jgi:histidyl-tRNA synthetase
MKDLKTIRGMPDLYDEDVERISIVENICLETFKSFNFQEFRTPIVENKTLFQRSVGESSDIIQKEVYEFEDRNGEILCLRPEGTAGLVRALITNGLMNDEIKKFFYLGPMFRYERPQKGRKRQFFQAGAELIGEESTKSDVEIILLAKTILEKLNVKYTLEINYLGKEDSLNSYRSYLRKYLQNFKDELSEKVYSRLQRNPIRAIDSKDSNIQEIFKKASDISDFLKKEEKESFERTIKSLKDLKIDFNLNKNLVRGLDYYTGTVFEFTVDGLGAQNAVIGGGRYDNLIKDLGGRDLPAIGFALGIDRLAEIINVTTRKKDIFIGSVDDDSINFAQYIGNKLRENIKGLVVENYLGNANVAKQLKKANSQGFKFAIIVGQEEQNTSSFKLKNLLDGSENTLNEIELVEFLNG